MRLLRLAITLLCLAVPVLILQDCAASDAADEAYREQINRDTREFAKALREGQARIKWQREQIERARIMKEVPR